MDKSIGFLHTVRARHIFDEGLKILSDEGIEKMSRTSEGKIDGKKYEAKITIELKQLNND